MEAGSAFEVYLERALELFGIEADETERMVMSGVWSLYEPGMEQLRDADLDEVEPELHLDLSQAPPR
ncbi:MAG TPA: hypothetical protein VKA88_03595 [Solirubrobacterales bacterium]|nr:hypothetical protein [Solirubrobacterales bacterium]